MNKVKIAPTLACADLMNTERDVRILDRCGIDTYHVDIMDGTFVPNYCLSWDFVKSLRKVTDKPIDVHLMTVNLKRDIETSLSLPLQAVAFHTEAAGSDTPAYISMIKKNGIKAGFALSPSTPLEDVEKYLEEADYILVMGVKPGFSGQAFLPETLTRVSKLDEIRREKGLSYEIYVDGGITSDIAVELKKRGADTIVAGMPTIFREKGKLKELTEELKRVLLS